LDFYRVSSPLETKIRQIDISPPFNQRQIAFLQAFIAVVVAFIIYLSNTLYFIVKYIKNTAKTL
jgi:hypothetical protein